MQYVLQARVVALVIYSCSIMTGENSSAAAASVAENDFNLDAWQSKLKRKGGASPVKGDAEKLAELKAQSQKTILAAFSGVKMDEDGAEEMETDGKIAIVGGIYDMHTGEVRFLK